MNISIDRNNPAPLHAQVENILREMSTRSEYIQGKPLPKEIDMAKWLGIARNTLRQATNKLVYEGLLVRKKGVGTFVVPKNVVTRLESWSSFTQEMSQRGVELKNYQMETAFEEADEELASILNINVGKKVLRLDRLRGDHETPFVLFVSYFHPRIGLTGKENFNRPLYKILEQDYSTRPVISSEEINAIKATADLALKLKIPVEDPLLFRKRRILDPGERIIEYNLCYYRGDKFTYSIDIKR